MSAAVPQTPPRAAAPQANEPRVRLEFLDGLRGLAALYVVLHHAFILVVAESLAPWLRAACGWLFYGHYAVGVFIVLSGYCLMLPIARSPAGTLAGGAREYLKRRARRILPPYYAAMLFSLLLIGLTVHFRPQSAAYPSPAWWDMARDPHSPAGVGAGGVADPFRPDVLASHALLVHNLRQTWYHWINAPHWSVATEWQIYFLLPFLFLPLWRRTNALAVVAVAFAVGAALTWLPLGLAVACPWYAGLFALGMAGAVVNFSAGARAQRLRAAVPWGWVAGLLAAAIVGAIVFTARRTPAGSLSWWQDERNYVLSDAAVGLLAACLIVACARRRLNDLDAGGRRSRLPRPLESRPALFLGRISYSLYLLHYIVLSLMNYLLAQRPVPAQKRLTLLLAAGVPLCLFLGWVFYYCFERPFLRARGGGKGAGRTGARS